MSNIRISELDFDTIKINLKAFLQDQTEFTDYDFEGSGLSILLDILAYNTHYNAYLANMLANEMFLDSAVKRSSATSLAKHLGYTPVSVRGSVATIDVTVTNPIGSPYQLTLPIFTPFTTTIDGTSYTFRNIEPITINPVNGVYTFSNVKVKEGFYLEFSYTVVTPGPDEKYEIPNGDVDTTTIVVTVQKSTTDLTTDTYTLASDLADITNTSKIYFLEENTNSNYQIYFGDNILGKKLAAGNIITIKYLVSSGAVCNVSGKISQSFTNESSIGGSNTVAVTTVKNSTGGADKETLSSIKFNAPRSFIARNRAVTKNDYASIIKANFLQVEAVSVWGGEDNLPPIYGKVFISLKPYIGYTIDEETKNNIKNTLLKERQVLTVAPVFVDPDYLYVNLNVSIDYNKYKTNLTAGQFQTLARSAIITFFSQQLEQFEVPFYHSQLVEKLNKIDPSVTGVLLEVKLQKRVIPILNISNSFLDEGSLKFNNKLQPNTFQSTRFNVVQNGQVISARIQDAPEQSPPNSEGTGILRLFNADTLIDIGPIGSINYSTGEVVINSITPVGFATGQFDIRLTCDVQKESYNLLTDKNQIIVYDDSDGLS